MAETKGSYHFTAEESESKGTAPNTVVMEATWKATWVETTVAPGESRFKFIV